MDEFETYQEAFIWQMQHRMEDPQLRQAEIAKELILEWLKSADDEISLLKQKLKNKTF